MDEAAAMLRLSRRTLTDVIGRHPHYVQGGKRKVFYEQDIKALIDALRAETLRKASTHQTSVPAVSGYEEVLEILKARKRSRSPRR